MSDAVRVETAHGVAVVTVDNPPVNTLADAVLEQPGRDRDERSPRMPACGPSSSPVPATGPSWRAPTWRSSSACSDGDGSIEDHVARSRRALGLVEAIPRARHRGRQARRWAAASRWRSSATSSSPSRGTARPARGAARPDARGGRHVEAAAANRDRTRPRARSCSAAPSRRRRVTASASSTGCRLRARSYRGRRARGPAGCAPSRAVTSIERVLVCGSNTGTRPRA